MSADKNPLNEDSKLKSLLNDVEAVDSAEGFFQWRTSFLEIYTTYLDTVGSEKAKASYNGFAKTTTALRKIVKQLENLLEQGNLAVGNVSVKARMSMSELKVKLGILIKEIMKLMPATDKEIKACEFSKWHMGAVLVADGFQIYAVMMSARALLKQLRVAALDDVADRQILDEIQYFGKKFDIFCGVMADLGLMSVCDKATELIYTEMLHEAQKAEETAKNLQREKLSATQHSRNSNGPKKLNLSKFEPNKPEKQDKDHPCDTVEESESSYETIEEEVTVSSYETVEKEDDSSYETVEEIEADSEYETDEEEIEVSDYETDTDSEDDSGDNKNSRVLGRKKSKGMDDKTVSRKGKGSSEKKKQSVSKPSGKKANGNSSGKRSAGKAKKGGTPSGNATDDEEEDSKGSDEDEEEDEAENNQPDESDSDDSDIPPPVKYGKSKPMPTQPEPKEDVYKPTERMKWKRKDYDPLGNCKREKKSLFPFRNNKKKKQPEPEPEPEPPKEKKYRRIKRFETIKVHRKKDKPPPKKIRVKKQKPPVKVKVRHEHKIIQKKRVKKNTMNSPIPTDIIVKEEKTEPTPLSAPECVPHGAECVPPEAEHVPPECASPKKKKVPTKKASERKESKRLSKSPKKKKRDFV